MAAALSNVDVQPATIESLLSDIGNARRRIATAYSDLFDQLVRMGFAFQMPNGSTAPAVPTPERTMLEEFGAEATQLEGLAASLESAAETLERQYRRGQPVGAACGSGQ